MRGKTEQKRRRMRDKPDNQTKREIGRKQKIKENKYREEGKEESKERERKAFDRRTPLRIGRPAIQEEDTLQQRPLKYIQSARVLLPYKVDLDGYARIRYVDSFVIRLAFHHGRGRHFTFSSYHGRPPWCKNGNRCGRLLCLRRNWNQNNLFFYSVQLFKNNYLQRGIRVNKQIPLFFSWFFIYT